ncbi:saccharopine dehydrogenase family protein [Luteithermobacter gelatinilyticus]|uniref:saccharopine dehydrogenase family protein n=1 Tax=Luteithermobacter gelatinilyticus TaxID=2582913 RepID=UPI00110691C8|nr:saccharopine dehydrogenase NADP-binding domain-containing protein [Luteithermobacter gelatinilyticus]|tara:strand:+ start:14164 stop:15354 length:1191 start_codon:yes stop_codon:yes gene_type:complete
MKIIILGGAGLMGTGIVRDLVSEKCIIDFTELCIADISAEKISAFIDEMGDPRLSALTLDIRASDDLAGILEGYDLCINSVPTFVGKQMQIFEACLAAGVPYIDLGGMGIYTLEQKSYHEKFKAAGVCAVIGVGADPGMSNVLCRAVADQLETIDRLNLYWAAEFVGPENPILIPPYSLSTVLAEYAQESTQFLNGAHVSCPPRTGVEVIELPDPWGQAEFMYSPHSEQLTVPLAEGIREKGIREFTWKLHLPRREHEAWIGLVKAGFGDFDEDVEVNGVKFRKLDLLNAVITQNIEKNQTDIPQQESHEIHFVIGRGQKNGRPCTVRGEVIVRPHADYEAYVDAATSMNASISAQLLLKSPRPGVWAPEEFFDVNAYFAEVQKRHFDYRLDIQEG